MMQKQPCVYILASQRNGTLYTGVTSDLVKRIWQHKNKGVFGNSWGFTRVMLSETKHPRGTGFFTAFRMTRTPADPKEPNKVHEGFTAKYNVHMLVYYEAHETMPAALTREKQIKKWNRQWKINLIETENPHWRDLWEDIV